MFEKIPDIMTFKECQKLLKVGKNTLLNLIDAFKIGNRWKITKESIIDYVKYR